MLSKYGSSQKIGEYASDFGGSKYEMARMAVKLKGIEQQMNHASHVFTQGSSADIFMPEWAGYRGIRPLTLYKRMAYASTKNTARNLKHGLVDKNGRIKRPGKEMDMASVTKPFWSLLATYFTGATLMSIHANLLGKAIPKENSDWWDRAITTMWRGEFLGILSDFISPYDGSVGNTLNPALAQNALHLVGIFKELGEGKIHFLGKDQALDEIVSKNFSAINQMRNIWDKK